jgi:hypothetical protein
MRDATKISIEELIIHIIDPRGQGLVVSNVTLPLSKNQALVAYFVSHIEETLKSPAIKAAQFRNINPDQPSGICMALLRKEMPLVEGSQSLANALYEILNQDHRITAGDLAVCLFQAENYPYTRFIAIMKVDPSQIFKNVILEDARGRKYVSFEADLNGFTSEKLQKCAIIQPLEPRHPDYDMLLLDRQIGGAEDRRVARFFSETFLDAKDAFDSYKYTDRLHHSLVTVQNKVNDRLSPAERQELKKDIEKAVSGRRLNLDRWLDDLTLAEDIKQEIDRTIRPVIPAREFNIDQSLSKKILKKVKYRGDNGLTLEIPSEFFNVNIASEELISDDPERTAYYRVVIETETWKRST